MGTRKYPVELRKRAVRLYRESDPKPVIRRLAEQLKVHPEALRNWIRLAEAAAGERDDRPTTVMLEENRRLARGNAELRRVNEVLRAASAYFASEIDPTRRLVMSFIDAHDFSVDLVLRVLGIAASTYYDWRARRANPGPRARQDAELLGMIDAIRGEHEFAATYGSPRVWLELRRRGVNVSRKRVERIMRTIGRRGAYLRKGWKHGSTRQNPRHTAAPDLLGRNFTATAPNTKWVADLTRWSSSGKPGELHMAARHEADPAQVTTPPRCTAAVHRRRRHAGHRVHRRHTARPGGRAGRRPTAACL